MQFRAKSIISNKNGSGSAALNTQQPPNLIPMIDEPENIMRDGAGPSSGLANFSAYMDAQEEVSVAHDEYRSFQDLIHQEPEDDSPSGGAQAPVGATDNGVRNAGLDATPRVEAAVTA